MKCETVQFYTKQKSGETRENYRRLAHFCHNLEKSSENTLHQLENSIKNVDRGFSIDMH